MPPPAGAPPPTPLLPPLTPDEFEATEDEGEVADTEAAQVGFRIALFRVFREVEETTKLLCFEHLERPSRATLPNPASLTRRHLGHGSGGRQLGDDARQGAVLRLEALVLRLQLRDLLRRNRMMEGRGRGEMTK